MAEAGKADVDIYITWVDLTAHNGKTTGDDVPGRATVDVRPA